ncbi:MAG: hypothetical protein J2P50_09625 [Hyphomicrobiaceae bacterium]|nr:hypothetical protein [Hyphomicrobiaceae bacterium]
MNILVAMEYRANQGNTHAISNYIRVGAELGHRIAFYGPPQPDVVEGWYLPPDMQKARFSTDLKSFDRILYVYESKLHRFKALSEVAILANFPRERRYIVDADGRFNPLIVVDGYDRSHLDETERADWMTHYEALGGHIIKPTIAPVDHPRVKALPFFGFSPDEVIDPAKVPPKKYDILHVGHNWYRWKEVSQQLLPAFEEIRAEVGEIAFLGLWWDGVPEWARATGLEPAFRSETERFRKLNIRIEPPVNYTNVIWAMSTGRINIFTQRPFLAHVKHLTLRYFEEFCADTIPLLMVGNDLAEAVYGPAGRELTLPGRVAEKMLDALKRPDYYREVVEDVRRYMQTHHSFRHRVEELITALSD